MSMYEDEDFEEGSSPKLRTLKKRNDFLLISKKGNSITTKGLVVQFAKISEIFPADNDNSKTDIDGFSTEIGFTSSKKIGSAVYRNRAKRRLKEAARKVLKNHPKLFKNDYKYNVIARHSALDRDFDSLVRDLKYALHNVD